MKADRRCVWLILVLKVAKQHYNSALVTIVCFETPISLKWRAKLT